MGCRHKNHGTLSSVEGALTHEANQYLVDRYPTNQYLE